jgi:PAS domain S-box-containing protein
MVRVLLVDDDVEYQLLVREMLRRAAYTKFELDWAGSASEALEALGRREHDVCLLDYRLGYTSGLELLRAARQREITTPVVLLTAQGDRDVERAALRDGADDYLDKVEVDPRTLERAIGHALERARTIDALKASEERFRRLFEHGPLGMGLIGPDLRFLKVNAALASMLGYTEQELIGMGLADVTHPDDLDKHAALAQRLFGGNAGAAPPPAVEKRAITRTGGTIWVDQRTSAIENEAGDTQYGLGIFENITARKQLEEQLRQVQKLDAIGRLAGGIAHDFNNLLTVIIGYSDALDTTLAGNDAAREDLAEVKKAAERAAVLTRQLLALSRRQMLQPRTVDVNAIVVSTDRMLRRIIGEDVRLRTVLDRELGTVRADPGQLEQVLLNLAVNAREAMPNGGTLTIATANVELGAHALPLRAPLPAGEYVRLSVSDTGVGMTAETMEHLFEPFFTTKGARGTGLGLATAYGIIKQSGGEIAVSSEPGRGAAFDVYLPRINEPVDQPPGPQPSASHGTETVLVVEDDSSVRSLSTAVLRQHGYQVFEVSRATDALDLIERYQDPVHLLVTDLVMPEVGGRELAALIKRSRSGIKVLYMSGYADQPLVGTDRLLPEMHFLQKPFTRTALARKVREILDEG